MRLGWTPDTFWHASLTDLFTQIDQWILDNTAEGQQTEPMSRDRFEELAAQYPDT